MTLLTNTETALYIKKVTFKKKKNKSKKKIHKNDTGRAFFIYLRMNLHYALFAIITVKTSLWIF